MTVPSSLVVMVPSPSLSNKEKASLNSAQKKGKDFSRHGLMGNVRSHHSYARIIHSYVKVKMVGMEV